LPAARAFCSPVHATPMLTSMPWLLKLQKCGATCAGSRCGQHSHPSAFGLQQQFWSGDISSLSNLPTMHETLELNTTEGMRGQSFASRLLVRQRLQPLSIAPGGRPKPRQKGCRIRAPGTLLRSWLLREPPCPPAHPFQCRAAAMPRHLSIALAIFIFALPVLAVAGSSCSILGAQPHLCAGVAGHKAVGQGRGGRQGVAVAEPWGQAGQRVRAERGGQNGDGPAHGAGDRRGAATGGPSRCVYNCPPLPPCSGASVEPAASHQAGAGLKTRLLLAATSGS
jgi:hypothetical protein